MKKLYRGKNKMLLGVCSGIAEYLKVDPTVIRIAWVLLTILTGIVFGIVAYFICAMIMPEK
ncbi:MAG TPA: PspC domain-containing protein [Candidatus Nanoarchaeia archaeon]|nr:PspC domain-containing protein [Candidatus Nanoarchaeia archaeon]